MAGGPENWHQRNTTEESVIFIAEVKAFSITGDQSTTQQESWQECSHVIVRRQANDEHKIVMCNYTEGHSSEVFSCCIHGNMQLSHSVEQNILTWTAGSDNVPSYNLELNDVTLFENLLSTLNDLMKKALATPHTNTLTDQPFSEKTVIAKEEKITNISSQSVMAVEGLSHSFVKESTTYYNSAVQKSTVLEINIPEENTGVDTELENVAGTNSEVDITGDDLSAASVQEESSKNIMAPTDETSAANGNELQCSEIDSEQIAPMVEPSHAVNLPAKLDLSSHSQNEEMYPNIPSADLYKDFSSNANLFYNSSRGAEEGFEQIKLTETLEKKCVNAMIHCYKKMTQVYETDRDTKICSKIHRHLAALICHQENRSPYAAILCTGTSHKDAEACNHEGSHGTCDGHAESIIYEAAPKYFMNEMDNLLKEKENESIFELLPNNKGYKLKPNVKFYLMVTEPPCGFIENQEAPCMEWKVPFVGFPHLPTCSSRILIGATMGIQGYISHLLEEPIMIDSLIILCSKGEELIKTDFTSSFPLPCIKTRRYNPRDFVNFEPNLVKRGSFKKGSVANCAVPSTSSENISVRMNNSGSEEHNSSVTLTGSDRNLGPSFLTFNPQTGEQSSCIPEFLMTRSVEKHIDNNVDQVTQIERKANMKQRYTDLCRGLEPEKAMIKLQSELANALKTKGDEISSTVDFTSTMLKNRTPNTLDELLQSTHTTLDNIALKQKWVKHSESIKEKLDVIEEVGADMIENQIMIMYIKNILSENKEIVVDCSWHYYFYKASDNNQPTD